MGPWSTGSFYPMDGICYRDRSHPYWFNKEFGTSGHMDTHLWRFGDEDFIRVAEKLGGGLWASPTGTNFTVLIILRFSN